MLPPLPTRLCLFSLLVLAAACGQDRGSGSDVTTSDDTSLQSPDQVFARFAELESVPRQDAAAMAEASMPGNVSLWKDVADPDILASLGTPSQQARADALPVVTDTDLHGDDSPVKSQGSRGTCTAFATVAAIEHVIKRDTAVTDNLSEEQLWSKYGSTQQNTTASLRAAAKLYLVEETVWPYNGSSLRSDLDGAGIAKMHPAAGTVTSPEEVSEALERGNPLVVALQITTAMDQPLPSDGVIAPDGKVTKYGHAMLVVGIHKDTSSTASYTGGGYYLIKNSWGSEGDHGYIKLPFSYCNDSVYCYFNEVSAVDVRARTDKN